MLANSEIEKYVHDVDFIAYLEAMMPISKKNKIAEVLPNRTKHITTVIENVLDTNNTNAILRTSEALGIQEAHLVYGNIKYIPQKSISKGAHLWIDTHKYGSASDDNALQCIKELKSKGFQVVITSPKASITLDKLDINNPIAICFGQESKGISETFMKHADAHIYIPQYGFTESYNVAVAAGMVLLPLMERLRKSDVNWPLNEEEKNVLRKRWTLNYFKHLDEHYTRFKNQ